MKIQTVSDLHIRDLDFVDLKLTRSPGIRPIPEKFQNDVMSTAYASNLESTVLKYRPDYGYMDTFTYLRGIKLETPRFFVVRTEMDILTG